MTQDTKQTLYWTGGILALLILLLLVAMLLGIL